MRILRGILCGLLSLMVSMAMVVKVSRRVFLWLNLSVMSLLVSILIRISGKIYLLSLMPTAALLLFLSLSKVLCHVVRCCYGVRSAALVVAIRILDKITHFWQVVVFMGSKYNVWYYPQAWIQPYKHVSLFSHITSDDDLQRREPVPYDGRLNESLSRTRRLFFDYAMCNDFDLFVTFTFDPERYNSMSYCEVQRKLCQWFSDYRKRKCPSFRYMLIPERHESGAWHFHGLCTVPPDLIVPDEVPKRFGNEVRMVPNTKHYLSWPAVSDKFGWFSCSLIRDYAKCVRYITKYVTKALDIPDLKGRRLLLKSSGLNKPELVKSTYESVSLPDGYASDFCTVAWRENLEDVPSGQVPFRVDEVLEPFRFLAHDVITEQMYF